MIAGWTIQILMALAMRTLLALSFVYDPATHPFWDPLERAIRRSHRAIGRGIVWALPRVY